MQSRVPWLVAWLLVLAAAQIVMVEAIRQFFVKTVRGQQLDTIALAGNSIGEGHVAGLVSMVLNTVSVLSVIAATVVIGFIALMRRRVLLAVVTTLMIVGANLTTQVVKAITTRPDLGIDMERVAAGNSFPSGHTSVTASVAVALVLVLPAAVRAAAALMGAGVATMAGVATLSAGWHRPSDAVAALLIVGAWAALAGVVLSLRHRDQPGGFRAGSRDGDGDRGADRLAVTVLAVLGAALLVVALAALAATDDVRHAQPEMLGRARLFVAYAGGAAGIAAVASMVMALLLATVHRVVPSLPPGSTPSRR